MLDFATALNMWDLVECLEPNNLHCHPQPLPAINFGFVTTSILNRQVYISLLLLAFSKVSFMRIDGVEWPLLLQCFPCVFGLGVSFHGSPLLCWFCD